ncbi:MAG: ribonuclease P protein subunit [Candidatus Nitrosotenuis sp.]|uniref:Ribonuclease P protein component 1 n=1 Tax=Candidatus Nitrosotenuis uzonensis TaxID=1407055 RepID=A0A812F3Y9_9ARCH|nr:ribonuclease P protein subunit [Candidatus Nitrosotenuis uzonensis]CAE6499859.1 Ribonuclease P protein component 1 [Candidatus Nitrosotenuis uzonensis]
MITAQNLVNHELIGLQTQIVNSTNNSIVGMSGQIIDETKSMLTLQTQSGVKMIQKQHNTWKFTLNSQDIIIDGNLISKRPEDRIKVKA